MSDKVWKSIKNLFALWPMDPETGLVTDAFKLKREELKTLDQADTKWMCGRNDFSLLASVCYSELKSNRKLFEMHVSSCEASSIPHIQPRLLLLKTSPFSMDRNSKSRTANLCLSLFSFSPPTITFTTCDCIISIRSFMNQVEKADF